MMSSVPLFTGEIVKDVKTGSTYLTRLNPTSYASVFASADTDQEARSSPYLRQKPGAFSKPPGDQAASLAADLVGLELAQRGLDINRKPDHTGRHVSGMAWMDL